jgi:myosin protein heavy chain
MPAPRASQSAEAARAAALQAEFNEKKWVWVPDEKEGYLAGWVNKEEDEIGEIVMAAGGEASLDLCFDNPLIETGRYGEQIRRVPLYALSKMNPPKFDRVDDIADLTFLNEASVVHNLRLRYGSGAIYVSSQLVHVSVCILRYRSFLLLVIVFTDIFRTILSSYQSLPEFTPLLGRHCPTIPQ